MVKKGKISDSHTTSVQGDKYSFISMIPTQYILHWKVLKSENRKVHQR